MAEDKVQIAARVTDDELLDRWESFLEKRESKSEATREAVRRGLEVLERDDQQTGRDLPIGVEKALDFSTIASTIAILFGLAAGLDLVDYAAGVTVGMVFAGLGLVALWAAWSGRAAALDEVLLRGGGGG